MPRDLCEEQHCREVVARAVREFGQIDLLVSNAGYQMSQDGGSTASPPSSSTGVNSVAPGPVWTPLMPATMTEDKLESFGGTGAHGTGGSAS